MDIERSHSGRRPERKDRSNALAEEPLLTWPSRPTVSGIPAYIFFFVMAAAPFPFGSYDKSIVAFWCLALAVCAIAIAFTPIRIRPAQAWIFAGLGVVVLGYAFVLHEQMTDRPWIADFHPIWARTSEVLGKPIAPSASIVRGEPFFALGPTVANILALMCGAIIGADRHRARQLMKVIAWSGAIYAIYGVASFLLTPNLLLWREKIDYVASVTGTFVNRNTAAAYFGSCAVIWLMLTLERAREHVNMRPLRWRRVPSKLSENPPRELLVSSGLFFLCLITLLMTTSRAGIVLSLAALAITFVMYFRRDLQTRSAFWLLVGGSVVFVLLLLQVFGGVVSSRFDVQGLADEGRFAAYASTLRMIGDFPWFGTGLGTFAWSFPAYRSPDISMNGLWDIAHNTPLELAAELGLPLALLVVAGWVGTFVVLLRGIAARRRDLVIPLAALGVAAIANLHSLIDFSLQIPGYSIIVFGLTGVGLSQSFRSAETGRTGQEAV